MPGWLTDGLPTIAPLVSNGVTAVAPAGQVQQLSAGALVPVDIQSSGGSSPLSLGASVFQIAAIAAEFIVNTATSTAGAATLNTKGGLVTTEALTTAVSATYTFTLTDSFITANTQLQTGWYSKSNTGGSLNTTSITIAAGSATIVATNVGTAALNGTMVLAFHA